MKVKFKGVLAGLLIAGVLVGCSAKTGSEADEGKPKQEGKIENQEELGHVTKYGKVKVLKEGDDFVLKGNDNVEYEMTDVKLVKIQDFSQDAKLSLVMSGVAENISSLPKSVYAIIGKEKRVNNTDEEIEFTGLTTLVAGGQQIDTIVSDFIIEDANNSTMQSGVTMDGEFGFVIKDPKVKEVKFILSESFDSETFSKEFSPETEIKIGLK